MSIKALKTNEPIEPYDYSLLLIGASGNGKSTFLNTFANFNLYKTPINLVPIISCKKYPIVPFEYQDDLPEKNDPQTGKSQTKHAHFYKIRSKYTKNKTILIVDTPGLASSGGVNEDDLNVNTIIDAARRVKSFNAIIILEKSSTNRLNPLIEYNLFRISEIIPFDFENRCILAFSFYTGDILFEDEWFPFPIQFKIKLNNSIFSLSGQEYKNKQKKLNEALITWKNLKKSFKKFLLKLENLNSIPTEQYKELFRAHNELNIKFAEYKVLIENIEKVKQSITSNQTERIKLMSWETTDYYNTMCREHKVICHERCHLSLNEQNGTDYFNNCACMNIDKKCRVCNCGSFTHFHIFKKPTIQSRTIEEFLGSLSINPSVNTKNEIDQALNAKETELIFELVKVETSISRISPNYKISDYVKKAIRHLDYTIELNKPGTNIEDVLIQKRVFERLANGWGKQFQRT